MEVSYGRKITNMLSLNRLLFMTAIKTTFIQTIQLLFVVLLQWVSGALVM